LFSDFTCQFFFLKKRDQEASLSKYRNLDDLRKKKICFIQRIHYDFFNQKLKIDSPFHIFFFDIFYWNLLSWEMKWSLNETKIRFQLLSSHTLSEVSSNVSFIKAIWSTFETIKSINNYFRFDLVWILFKNSQPEKEKFFAHSFLSTLPLSPWFSWSRFQFMLEISNTENSIITWDNAAVIVVNAN